MITSHCGSHSRDNGASIFPSSFESLPYEYQGPVWVIDYGQYNRPHYWHYQSLSFEQVRIPATCPVCKGKGSVPRGFYRKTTPRRPGQNTSACRSCDGKGLVWEPRP